MVGEKLGSYRIESTLGVGAMGVVYKATHETSNRVAAVKVVSGEIAQKGRAFERFRREADILQQFRHPNIVRFFAVGRYKGTSYFAMEFIQGKTLEQLLTDHGPFGWKEVVEFGLQLCVALHYAHEHGVVHRDLKPSNLMVTEDGKVKLTDFGIAKDLDATALTATGRTLGTAAYMAPEQIRGTPEISHKTDLYALGCVFYQMLTGKLPFEGNSAMVMMHGHLNGPVPRPSAKVVEIPRALDDLVVQLMAKNPPDRPWDAAAVAETLRGMLAKADKGETIPMVWPTAADGTVAGPLPSVESPKKKKKKTQAAEGDDGDRARRLLETAGLVAALAVVGGLIAYWLWPPGADHLHRKAEALMASDRRTDWMTAIERYVDPLDRRFPEHPWRDQTRQWRDRLLLAEAEGAAKFLTGPLAQEPKGPVEQRYVAYKARSDANLKAGDDEEAARVWDQMAADLNPSEPNERPWHLLAKSRADAIRKEMDRRRQLVTRLLGEVELALRRGRPVEAQELMAKAAQYARFKHLWDVIPETLRTPAPAPAPPGATGPAVAPPPSPTTPPVPGAPALPPPAPPSPPTDLSPRG